VGFLGAVQDGHWSPVKGDQNERRLRDTTMKPHRTVDIVVGEDGRGLVAGGPVQAIAPYHDKVWGTANKSRPALFEALTLGVFQVGLSWAVVLSKRDSFASAFYGFDISRVSTMGVNDVVRLLQDPSIIRNRAKIEATISNAQVMDLASPNLETLVTTASLGRRAPMRSCRTWVR
jgi:DNA-3-methyladenine glycosylase I